MAITDVPRAKTGKRNIPRALAASRLFWDRVMGPGYNKRVLRIGREFYGAFVAMLVEGGDIPPAARILDVGSGPGLVTLLLAEAYPLAQVTGIDHSPRQVRAANRMLSREPISNCGFEVGNAVDLPYAEGSFDVVVSTFSLSCWPQITRGLEEIRRVLVPDGSAFIVDADSGSTQEEIRRFTTTYAAAGSCRRLQEWFTRRFVFGPAVAIDGDTGEAMAAAAGFGRVVMEKRRGLPFFRLILRK
ncbi:MAG: class I SAM-dependent methyltransferase [Actinobacteria bacterium]|jgi:ubiquinone/menaquinone biosynthesis C-methylase UbiE|nr:MAG: class I SAM-dependent methyltransferase [Actinomycetota bacterium]